MSYKEFARGRAVLAEAAVEEPGAVVQAFERLVESIEKAQGYDFFRRNCEHFARKVVFGEDRSLQVEVLLFVAALVVVIAVLGRR